MPEDLLSDIKDLYKTNRRDYEGNQYIVPSPQTYPYQWLWDSCFHAVVLSHFDTELAKQELLSLFSQQFDNGMLPHIIYWQQAEAVDTDWGKQDPADIAWGKEGVSSITQPPMCAYAVWRVYQSDQDKDFLSETYDTLVQYHQYLLDQRDPEDEHLLGIIHPDESGEDNSPRFDRMLNLPASHSLSQNFNERMQLLEKLKECNFNLVDCVRDHFWVQDVLFNSVMVKNLQVLSKIADTLDKPEDAQLFADEHEAMITAMRTHMQQEDGLFYSVSEPGKKPVRVLTWATFMPLFAGILDQNKAEDLVSSYMCDEDMFASAYPVPTVPLSGKSYESKRDSMWRGPTWIGANWFIYHGLKQYGFEEQAANIKHSSQELVRQSGFAEYYDPESGDPLGAQEFTWGGLVLDMQ